MNNNVMVISHFLYSSLAASDPLTPLVFFNSYIKELYVISINSLQILPPKDNNNTVIVMLTVCFDRVSTEHMVQLWSDRHIHLAK